MLTRVLKKCLLVLLVVVAYQNWGTIEARKAYEALGGRGIPILDVNGTLIRGYEPQNILKALAAI
ncbi:hypothetical protein [Pseudomonas sp. R1-15]|uniref:hypothetical protein n=1 Tax=Pseudomonas sp. R1-15 TaxID=2817399 RepID=UPI003DA8011D